MVIILRMMFHVCSQWIIFLINVARLHFLQKMIHWKQIEIPTCEDIPIKIPMLQCAYGISTDFVLYEISLG